jgi:hypothetical protein
MSEGIIYPPSSPSDTSEYISVLFTNADDMDLYLDYLENSSGNLRFRKRRLVERKHAVRNRVVRFKP